MVRTIYTGVEGGYIGNIHVESDYRMGGWLVRERQWAWYFVNFLLGVRVVDECKFSKRNMDISPSSSVNGHFCCIDIL